MQENTIEYLVSILERLRGEGGCPWDRAQTRESLSRCLAEECAELLEAIDSGEPSAICDELGDLLMNAVFQAVVAKERGEFTLEDVLYGINSKMVRRHAHIFGNAHAETAEDVTKLWEKIKSGENRPVRESVLDGIPCQMSALARAEKIQKKAAKTGFDWTAQEEILDKIAEELEELRQAVASGDEEAADEELGDLLFAAVNLSRFRKRRTAEELLRAANRKFIRRFQYIEKSLKEQNIPLETAGLARLESLWQEAKSRE